MRLRAANNGAVVLALLTAGTAAAQGATSLDDEASIARFEAQIKARQYADVADPLEKYTASHPESWRALYQLGYVDFRLHRIRESLIFLSKSLFINGDFAEAHKILALDLNILGRKDLAIGELQRAIQLEPGSFESHYELGRIYYDAGFYLQSVEQLALAKSLDPSVVKVYHNLGLAYAAVGDNSNAVENFEEGLKLNAKQSKPSAWPLIDYASYLNSQNNFDKSSKLLVQAIDIDANWDQEFDELSRAYRGLGKADLAIESLKRAVLINPRKAEYHYVLARLYSQTHQSAAAKQELSEYEKNRNKGTNVN
jgi:tetratricopeptide (TPR) repeat protein